MSNNTKEEIAKRFKQIRETIKCKKLTQEQFSKMLGLTQSQISQIETCKENVSVYVLVRLERFLNINSNWLLNGEGEMYLDTNIDNYHVKAIDRRLSIIKKELGLKQEEFAEKIGLPVSKVRNIENGIVVLEVSNIKALSEVFNVNINWIMNGIGDMFKK